MTDYQDLVKRLRALAPMLVPNMGWTREEHQRPIEAAEAIETLTRERDEARELLREAGKALKPFERFDRLEWKGTMFENRSDDASVFHHRASGTDVTLGDFRRARAVLARIEEAVDD